MIKKKITIVFLFLSLLSVISCPMYAMDLQDGGPHPERFPLHYACMIGDLPAVARMIDEGRRVNEVDHYICTPLSWAVRCGVPLLDNRGDEIVKLLPCYPRRKLETYCAIAERLLEAGAWSNNFAHLRGRAFGTPGPNCMAASFGDANLIQIFLNAPDFLSAEFLHMLFHAAVSGNKETFDHLLQNGAVISQSEIDILLQAAIHGDNIGIVSFLLDQTQCADVSFLIKKAVSYQNESTVRLLICRGAKVNLQEKLSVEVEEGSCRSYRDFTPLHMAVVRKNIEIMRLLIGRGANVDAVAYRDGLLRLVSCKLRPVDMIGEVGINHAQQIRDYLNHVARPTQALIRAIALSSAQTEGSTARSLEEVQHALQEGADVNIQVRTGDTPMHLAVRLGRWDIARELLKRGPDLMIQNYQGQTVFDCASVRCRFGRLIELLQCFNLAEPACIDPNLPEDADACQVPPQPRGIWDSVRGYVTPTNVGAAAAAGVIFWAWASS